MLHDSVVDPLTKAIWYIESHTSDPVDLDAIAQHAGVSRFHLTRAFGQVTGYSAMRYVKARRLTVAAQALASGAPDILHVALGVGYGSHEAFTRAFREQFGVTPESIRAQASLDGLALVEAFRRDQLMPTSVAAPRIEKGALLLIAGFAKRIGYDTIASIPQLWQRLGPHIGHIPNEIPGYAYGVKFNSDNDGFEYLAGVAVSTFEGLPSDFRTERIPAQTYAVFTHHGHVSGLHETMKAIWHDYIPTSGLKVVDAPEYESYGRIFDPQTGNGDVEIFIPIQASL